MALETEVGFYNELLPELLEQGEGKYVVIKGRELLGVYGDSDLAYGAGLERYGFTSFLLRPIRAVQPVLDLTNLHLGLIRGGV
jgi:hypothetical protein